MNLLEDLVNHETKLIERVGYKDSDFDSRTKKNIGKLFKLLLIEQIVEESDKHNVSKRTMDFGVVR